MGFFDFKNKSVADLNNEIQQKNLDYATSELADLNKQKMLEEAQKRAALQYKYDDAGNSIINGTDVANSANVANNLKSGNNSANAASNAGLAAGAMALDKANQAGAFGGRESTGGVLASSGSMALTGASISGGSPIGAGIGAAAGLTMGLLGAAAAKKERQRNAAVQYYNNMASIEEAKASRIAQAQQNMSNAIGNVLSQNQVVRL